MGRRDPLAATRQANTADRMRRQREAMTPDAVRADMARIIRAKLEIDESISLDDFSRANLPMQQVRSSFPAVLSIVRQEMGR